MFCPEGHWTEDRAWKCHVLGTWFHLTKSYKNLTSVNKRIQFYAWFCSKIDYAELFCRGPFCNLTNSIGPHIFYSKKQLNANLAINPSKHICFYHLKLFLKIFNFLILNYFDVPILKIILYFFLKKQFNLIIPRDSGLIVQEDAFWPLFFQLATRTENQLQMGSGQCNL